MRRGSARALALAMERGYRRILINDVVVPARGAEPEGMAMVMKWAP